MGRVLEANRSRHGRRLRTPAAGWMFLALIGCCSWVSAAQAQLAPAIDPVEISVVEPLQEPLTSPIEISTSLEAATLTNLVEASDLSVPEVPISPVPTATVTLPLAPATIESIALAPTTIAAPLLSLSVFPGMEITLTRPANLLQAIPPSGSLTLISIP